MCSTECRIDDLNIILDIFRLTKKITLNFIFRGKMTKACIKNTLIVIPVYNSESHLEELLLRLLAAPSSMDILCINDGSLDNSLHVIKKHGIKCINLEKNRGKGFALRTGLTYAKNNGYEFVLTMDSDLQHDPSCVPNFLKTQGKESADLVIGFRDFNPLRICSYRFVFPSLGRISGNMPIMRILSNYITSCIVSCMTKQNILDSQSGYRLYNLELFEEAEIKTDRYQMETEILLNYIRKNAVIAHTEIPIIYNDEKSYISHFRDIVNFVKVIISEWLGSRE